MYRWRPRTIGVVISGLALILVAVVVSFMFRSVQPSTGLRLGSGVFNIQIADTDDARIRGLSGVNHLDANEALLMIFQSDDEWGIWMKDMKIPLDIIWMNNDKKVIYIVTNASPNLGTSKIFTPETPARYVLEVPAGTVESARIKIGNTAAFNITEAQ